MMHEAHGRTRPVAIALIALAILASLVAYPLIAITSPVPPSDFWGSVGSAYDEVEHFTSVAGMAHASDAVVLGTIENIEKGRVFGDEGDSVTYAAATVRISRLLSGSLPEEYSQRLILEIMLPMDTPLEVVKGLLPENRSVFFLRSKAVDAARYGYTPQVQADEHPYYRLVVQRGVISEVQGLATAPGWTDSADFMSDIEGRPFEEIVSELGH